MRTRRVRRPGPALLGAVALLALVLGSVTLPARAAPVCDPAEWGTEIFDGTALAGATLVERCDDAIDADWGAGSPAEGVPPNQFSVRWTRTIDFAAGDHRFTATADDGVRVLLDGEGVLDGWRDQGATSYTATLPVTAGPHTVVVEYYEAFGDASARFSVEPVTPVAQCDPAQWSAEFFLGSTLSGDSVARQCDSAVDADWGSGSPGPAVPANQFSARWTRTIDFAGGDYSFEATADDGVRVLLDGVVVVDGWRDQAATEYAATVPVSTGTHAVVVEYYEAFGDASVRFSYQPVTTIDPPADCEPSAWSAQYYTGTTLSGAPVLQRCDAAVDFDWGAGSPDPAVPANQFSARWTSQPVFEPGTYTFRATSDDGVRVLLDGELVLDGWRDQSVTSYEAAVPVSAGPHTLVVEYYEKYGDAIATLSYARAEEVPDDPRAVTGEWKQNSLDMPVRSIHASVLEDGNVLLVAGSGNNRAMFEAGTFRASLWNPVANSFTEIPVPEDMFCAGHAHLTDGNLMLAGGNRNYPDESRGYGGLVSNYEYDIESRSFVRLPSMQEGRWYPTLTTLGNGNIQVVGGINEAGNGGTVLVEQFDPATRSWVQGVPQRWAFWGLYPSLHLMDDGKLFYSGTNTFGSALPGSALWDLETDTVEDLPLSEPDRRDQSASVLLPPAQDQKVMVMGGGKSFTGEPATSSTMIHDLRNGTHATGPPLSTAKMYVNSVILPDRTVLETGGAESNGVAPKHTTAIYDPRSSAFTPVPGTPDIDRMYHSSALLLPDGRVAVMGSNPEDGSFEMRISLYSPGYLFRGPRPEITSAPAEMAHGGSYDLAMAAERPIREVSLIRPMSVTHQLDPNARLVDVPFTPTAHGVSVDVPGNPNLLPPGPYMLVVTDTGGVPSVASWVHVPDIDGATTAANAVAASAEQVSFAGLATPDHQAMGHSSVDLSSAPRRESGDDPTAAGDEPWSAPAPDGRWAGHTNYGPSGGPRITATTIGDGCDHNYAGTSATVCVPVEARLAPHLDKAAGEPVRCDALRRAGYLEGELLVVGTDTQRLDPDRNGVACEEGES